MKNTGKKESYIRDTLGMKGGGIYAITPFDRVDKYGKTLFKIGQSTNLHTRMEEYYTSFPTALYIIAVIQNPPVRIKGVKYVKQDKKRSKYLEIEKFIFNYIVERGAIQYYSTTRIRNANVRKEGQTEWFYTDEDLIFEAFEVANLTFGGKFYHAFLPPDINKEYAKMVKNKPNFVGNIVYQLKEN